MADRLSARTRLVFIANPNNPTGTMVGRKAWTHSSRAARKKPSS